MASQFSSGFDSDEMVAAAPLYTSRAEMESIWSTLGVDNRLDDDDDGLVGSAEEDDLLRVMEEATDEVNGYLGGTYSLVTLGEVRRIRRMASYLACHFLSERRGNLPSYCQKVEDIRETLQRIRDGKIVLPGVPKAHEFLPGVSNYTVDRRHGHQKLRVDAYEGVDGQVPTPRNDWGALGW